MTHSTDNGATWKAAQDITQWAGLEEEFACVAKEVNGNNKVCDTKTNQITIMTNIKLCFIIKCNSFEKDAAGNITTVYATYFPESKSGSDTSGIHVKGTLHWVSAAHAVPVVLNEYDRLFNVERNITIYFK